MLVWLGAALVFIAFPSAARAIEEPSAEASTMCPRPEVAARIVDLVRTRQRAPLTAVEQAIRRARRASWLPSASLGARHGRGWDRASYVTSDVDRARLSLGNTWSFDATLRFPLRDLAFAPEEPQLQREMRFRMEQRERIADRALKLIYRRCELLRRELDEGELSPSDRAELDETNARLHILTGGAFTTLLQMPGDVTPSLTPPTRP